jgi:putative addiction module killer protein
VPLYTITDYETPAGRRPVIEWLEALDESMRHRVTARIERFEQGGFGDHKPLTGQRGLFEARMHFGPGSRLYFAKDPQRVVLLLCGGDKRSQRSDVRAAVKLYRQYREEN